MIQIMFCVYYIISAIWDKIILHGTEFWSNFFGGVGGWGQGLRGSRTLPTSCVCLFISHHTQFFVLSNTVFIIIRVVTVQMFTDVSSTFGIQNGVVKFNSDQC